MKLISSLVCAVLAGTALATPPVWGDSLAPQSQQPSAGSLNLVCLGAGSANRVASMYGYGSSGWGQIVGQKEVAFDDQVTLEIQGDEGRIRMPRSMLPPIRGGKDGWFEVKGVRWSENEIIGTIQVNVVNSPKLRLDRLQGMIAINGKAGDYSGRCEPFDPSKVERKF